MKGRKRRKEFFEGWYFKQAQPGLPGAFSLIPGVVLGDDPHSFIQLIDGIHQYSRYFRFPLESSSVQRKPLAVSIDHNRFSLEEIHLDMEKEGIKGTLALTHLHPYPKKFFAPGIMGPFSFVPFMECYHGVVSMDHRVNGILETPAGLLHFQDARGYAEKDRGTSFPQQWIWLQGNSFETPRLSIMLSIARIPWLGSSFTGFIGFVMLKDRLFPFNSYNGSSIKKLEVGKGELEIVLKNRSLQWSIQLKQHRGELLQAPVEGRMERGIKESVDSDITFRLEKAGQLIVSGESSQCGSEISGYN